MINYKKFSMYFIITTSLIILIIKSSQSQIDLKNLQIYISNDFRYSKKEFKCIDNHPSLCASLASWNCAGARSDSSSPAFSRPLRAGPALLWSIFELSAPLRICLFISCVKSSCYLIVGDLRGQILVKVYLGVLSTRKKKSGTWCNVLYNYYIVSFFIF